MSIQQKATSVKKRRRRTLTNAVIATALDECLGNISHASEVLQCDRTTLSKRINDDPELLAAKQDGINRIVDIAKDTLVDKVRAGDVTATIFTLKTLGRDQGFVESPRTFVQQTNTVQGETVESPEERLERWRQMLIKS